MRPFVTYARLRREPQTWRQALAGVGRWLLVIACFVSWTTAGRLLPDHLLLAPLSWLFAPLLQVGALLVARRATTAAVPAAALVAHHFRGHGPWFIWLLLVAGTCLFAPAVIDASGPQAGTLLLAALLAGLVAAAWAVVLTYALFRAALQLSRRASVIASCCYYLTYAGGLLGYYAVAGQLAPILGWVS